MKVEAYAPQRNAQFEAASITNAAHIAARRGLHITHVADREVVGTCEGCGLPVFSDDEHAIDCDGIVYHTWDCCDIEIRPDTSEE